MNLICPISINVLIRMSLLNQSILLKSMNNYHLRNVFDVQFHLKKVLKHSGNYSSFSNILQIILFSNSSDPLSNADPVSTHRNTHLTYDDISINDILIVTWGNNGAKQYPARCIEKNDEKKEIFVHYTGWNSR